MAAGVLVLDDQLDPVVSQPSGSERPSLIVDERHDVLVFDAEQTPRGIAEATPTDFLLFDATAAVLEVVEAPQDFLLVEADPEPAKVVLDGHPDQDLLILTAGGPPGEIGLTGPPGPQGIPGADGPGAYFREFSFATPSTVWTIVHNQHELGLVVELVDQNGDPMEGYVRHVDLNTVEVDWYYPTAGAARLFR